MGQAEQERHNRISRTGQPGWDCQDRTARKGLPGRATKIGLPAQDCQDKTARAEQKGEDSLAGQLQQGSQNGIGRTG
jgi:hypothetical protein